MKKLKLNDELSIVELEERFEMTTSAADSLRCGDGATVKTEQS